MLADLKLPELLSQCETDAEREIIRGCFTIRGARGFRKSKPYKRVTTPIQGYANYVWRMLAFDFAGCSPYNCMPVMADCDVYMGYKLESGFKGSWGDAGYDDFKAGERAKVSELDLLVKRVESALPITAQSGVMQWGRALGYLG